MNINMDIDETCTICAENYDDSIRRRTITPCGHTLCSSCLLDTFKSSNKCPFCRQKLDIIINKKEEEEEEEVYNFRLVINNKLYTIYPYTNLITLIISLGLLLIN